MKSVDLALFGLIGGHYCIQDTIPFSSWFSQFHALVTSLGFLLFFYSLSLFFSIGAAFMFDVFLPQEQGIGYTPQTGNEEFY